MFSEKEIEEHKKVMLTFQRTLRPLKPRAYQGPSVMTQEKNLEVSLWFPFPQHTHTHEHILTYTHIHILLIEERMEAKRRKRTFSRQYSSEASFS